MRIEKQQNCTNCPFFRKKDKTCTITHEKNGQSDTTTLSNCPLPMVSVPEDHGDLIDRYDMIDKLSDKSYCKNCNNLNGICCTNCRKKLIKDTIIDYLYNQNVVVEATS